MKIINPLLSKFNNMVKKHKGFIDHQISNMKKCEICKYHEKEGCFPKPEVEKCTNKSHRYVNAETGKCMKCEKEPEGGIKYQNDYWARKVKIAQSGILENTIEPEVEKKELYIGHSIYEPQCVQCIRKAGPCLPPNTPQPFKVDKKCDCKTKYCPHYENDFERFCKENPQPSKCEHVGQWQSQKMETGQIRTKFKCEKCFFSYYKFIEPSSELPGCPPHVMIPFTYVGSWSASVPPPNSKCTKCLLETRF